MVVVSILVMLLAVLSIDFNGLKSRKSLGLSKDNTTAFRGILALTVVLCHLTGNVDYKIPIFGFTTMGPMAVGAFFILSGYAVYKNTLKHKNYLDNFLYNRLVKILLPFFGMIILYLLLICLVVGQPLKFVLDEFIDGRPVSNSWYVLAILYLYFAYWFAFKKIKFNNFWKSFILLIFSIFVYFIFVEFVFDWPYLWYRTIFTFPLGILYAKYEDKIKSVLHKRYAICFITTFAFLGFSYLLPAIVNRIIKTEIPHFWFMHDVLMALAFSIFTMVLLVKFNFSNKITEFLGNISYEVYIFHGLVMTFLKSDFVSFPMNTHFQQELYAIAVFLITFVISYVMHKLSNYIIPKLLKEGKQ